MFSIKNVKGNEIKCWILLDLATLEINATYRMQHFFWYCLNTTVYEYNDFNTGAVDAIQKKFV